MLYVTYHFPRLMMYRVATKSRTTNRSLQKVHDFEKFPWNFSSSAAATRFLSRFSVFHIYVAQSSPLVFTLHPISLHDLCDSHPRLLCDVLVFVLLRWCITQITEILNWEFWMLWAFQSGRQKNPSCLRRLLYGNVELCPSHPESILRKRFHLSGSPALLPRPLGPCLFTPRPISLSSGPANLPLSDDAGQEFPI